MDLSPVSRAQGHLGFQKQYGHQLILTPSWHAQLRVHKFCGQESHLLLYLQRLSHNIQFETLPTMSVTCLGSLPKPYLIHGQTRQTSLTKWCLPCCRHQVSKFPTADKAKAYGECLLLLCVQLLRGEEEAGGRRSICAMDREQALGTR